MTGYDYPTPRSSGPYTDVHTITDRLGLPGHILTGDADQARAHAIAALSRSIIEQPDGRWLVSDQGLTEAKRALAAGGWIEQDDGTWQPPEMERRR